MIGWRQSTTTGDTHRERVSIRQFPQANNGLLATDDTALDKTDSDNNLELQREAEQQQLHRMAKVHDFLELCQGSQNLHVT